MGKSIYLSCPSLRVHYGEERCSQGHEKQYNNFRLFSLLWMSTVIDKQEASHEENVWLFDWHRRGRIGRQLHRFVDGTRHGRSIAQSVACPWTELFQRYSTCSRRAPHRAPPAIGSDARPARRNVVSVY